MVRRIVSTMTVIAVAALVAVNACWVSADSTTQAFLVQSGQRAGMPWQGALWNRAVLTIVVADIGLGAILRESSLTAVAGFVEVVAALLFAWIWRHHFGIRSDWGNDYLIDALGMVFFTMPVAFGLTVGAVTAIKVRQRNDRTTLL